MILAILRSVLVKFFPVLFAASLAYIVYYTFFAKAPGSCNKKIKSKEPALEPQESNEQQHSESELMVVAKAAKEAGFKCMGVSQCGWSRKQRELFGNSEARKVFEGMYVECRNSDACKGVVGYPTWQTGAGELIPGFKDLNELRSLILSNPRPPPMAPEEAAPSAAVVEPAPPPMAPEEPAAAVVERIRGVAESAPLNAPNLPGVVPAPADSHSAGQQAQGILPRAFAEQAMPDFADKMRRALEEARSESLQLPELSS